MKKIILSLFGTLLIISITNICYAATYYMATTGSDSANGSQGTPWLTLQYAYQHLSGGDTLIIEDGTYTGSANQTLGNTPNNYPPFGSAGAWTTIKARNDGAVMFDGQSARVMVDVNLSGQSVYWQFEGIVWQNCNDSHVSIYNVSYVKFLRCGFGGTMTTNGGASCHIGNGVSYALVEGCYAWGGGRYKFLFGGAVGGHNIFRNCVVRLDYCTVNDPIAGFSGYGATDCEVQNCILIDTDQSAYYSGAEYDGGFFSPSTSGPSRRINFTNCIVLNSTIGAFGTANDSDDVVYNNCVFWDFSKLDNNSNMVRGERTQFLHCTMGVAAATNAILSSYDGEGHDNNTTLNSSIMYGLHSSNSGDNVAYDVEIKDYNSFYGNTPGNYSSGSGAHDLTNINPIYNTNTNPTGALKYITRIETGSTLSGLGEAVSDIGANIKTLIGTPGTLWGETGYNTDTGIPMWPFPKEDLIRTKMKAFSGGGVSGNRGFCADGTTLTKYIWEYLGNTIPSEIYGSSLSGDLTGDGQVNIQDLQACVNHILGTQDWGARADVNGDGSVNILDVQGIANIILGM